MTWFSNGWVVGIGTSLVAGALISVISWLFLSRRQKQDFQQRVTIANREIIYAIRPGIAEGQIPVSDVLDAIGSATARKYSIERSDLFSPREIAEELMKEVMDSSFLSSIQKNEYCGKLIPLRTEVVLASQVKQRIPFPVSDTVGIFATVIGVASSIAAFTLQKAGLFKKLDGIADSHEQLFLASLVVGTLMLAIVALYMTRRTMADATSQINKLSEKVRGATKNIKLFVKP